MRQIDPSHLEKLGLTIVNTNLWGQAPHDVDTTAATVVEQPSSLRLAFCPLFALMLFCSHFCSSVVLFTMYSLKFYTEDDLFVVLNGILLNNLLCYFYNLYYFYF